METLTKPQPIFVADDSLGEQGLIREALKKCEVQNQVFYFENGEELMTALLKTSAVAGVENLPCMILLDIRMPVMDGWEALERIKGDPKLNLIPIVLLTNSAAAEDVDKGYHLGAARYITKPSNLDALVGSMRSLREFWENKAGFLLDRLDFGLQLRKDGPPHSQHAEKLVIHTRTAKSNTSVVVMDMEGALDVNTVGHFEDELLELFNQGKFKIVLNLEKTAYVSSAGFGVLISVIKDVRRRRGDIKIANVSPAVYNTFDLLELPGLFHILKTEQEAVDKFQA